MKNKGMRFLMLVLSCALLLTAMPVSAAAASTTGFPDVPAGIWYEDELEKIMWAQQMVGQTNIISGLYNDEGVLVFEPEREVTRGEFLKMLFEAAESSGNQVSFETNEAQSKAHWAGKYYTKAGRARRRAHHHARHGHRERHAGGTAGELHRRGGTGLRQGTAYRT